MGEKLTGERFGRTGVRWILIAGGAFLLVVLGLIWSGASSPDMASAKGGISATNISPQIASDNDRYVAFQRRNRIPTVLDTYTGEFNPLKGAWYCQPRDIGGERVLLICPHGPGGKHTTGFRARVGSVHGGKTIRLARSNHIYDAYEIGRYWVSIGGDSYPGYQTSYDFINWRKGYLKNASSTDRDLDSRKLKRLDLQSFKPDPKGYPNPYVDPLHICRRENFVFTDWKGELRLWSSENSSIRIGNGGFLGNGCKWYGSFRVGPSVISWNVGPVVHAYNYVTGAHYDKRYKKPGVRVTPIRDGIVVAKKIKKFNKFRKVFHLEVIRF